MAEEEIKQEEGEEGAPEWMVTFGDMMTLLLCFFVLLLSFSQMDVAKFKELAGSLEKAFGVQRKLPVYERPKGMKMVARDFDQSLIEQAKFGELESKEATRRLEAELEKLGLDDKLLSQLQAEGLFEVETQDDQIVLRLMGYSTFDSGSAEIKPQMIPLLTKIGSIIGRSNWDIIVAGHTDNVPIRKGGRYGSNLELSAARAASVVKFFIHRGLVAPEKIATMAFGEYRPLVPNDTPENRSKNRRVEIILTRLPSPGTPSSKTTPQPAESEVLQNSVRELLHGSSP
ncbi:MAG: type VI secretion system protein TssL [Nitrospinota bacterium]|nr:MAG: type VI secretion system protein TssL [Nitrospinota bacterium]